MGDYQVSQNLQVALQTVDNVEHGVTIEEMMQLSGMDCDNVSAVLRAYVQNWKVMPFETSLDFFNTRV